MLPAAFIQEWDGAHMCMFEVLSLHACMHALLPCHLTCHTAILLRKHLMSCSTRRQGSIHAHPLACSGHLHVQAAHKPMIGTRMCMALAPELRGRLRPFRHMHDVHAYSWTFCMGTSTLYGSNASTGSPFILQGVLGVAALQQYCLPATLVVSQLPCMSSPASANLPVQPTYPPCSLPPVLAQTFPRCHCHTYGAYMLRNRCPPPPWHSHHPLPSCVRDQYLGHVVL
jgi:hypothetical protein